MEELRNNIKSFDLLMSTTTSIFSKIINFAQYYIGGTEGKFSHIAICIWGDVFPDDTVLKHKELEYKIDKNELYILESVFSTKEETTDIFGEYFDGVQIRKFNDVYQSYCKLIDSKYMTDISLAKLKNDHRNTTNSHFMNDDNKKKFLEFVYKHMRIEYNFGVIDKIYIPLNNYIIISKWKDMNDYLFKPSNGIICTEIVALVFKELALLDQNTNIKNLMPEQFLTLLCDEKLCLKKI